MEKIPVNLKTSRQQTKIILPDGKSWVDVRPELPDLLKMSPQIFERIWDMHPTTHNTTKMFGKEIPNPRWERAYGHSYKYGGMDHDGFTVDDPYLSQLLEWVKKDSGLPYQGLLINWYENGDHYIGWHADNERAIVENSSIYSFSYGQEREFQIKTKSKSDYLHKITMKDGSLIIMGGEMQKHYKHCVPKRALSRCPNKRINITFRLFK